MGHRWFPLNPPRGDVDEHMYQASSHLCSMDSGPPHVFSTFPSGRVRIPLNATYQEKRPVLFGSWKSTGLRLALAATCELRRRSGAQNVSASSPQRANGLLSGRNPKNGTPKGDVWFTKRRNVFLGSMRICRTLDIRH